MKVTIHPSQIKGSVAAPSSKSSMQRACAAALLAPGNSVIQSPGTSNDDKAAIDVIQKLGATVKIEANGSLSVQSNGVRPLASEINCGESGLGIRMFTPLAALSSQPLQITGSGSLVSRPMDFFDEIFPKIGVSIISNQGKLPLNIQGPIVPADITVDGSLSSQFLTGLLMSYAAAGAKNVSIFVNDLKSRPYIDLTLDVLKKFGVDIKNREYKEFYFPETNEGLTATKYTVEGDWSGGAFLLVAGAIGNPITVTGLDPFSTQADKAILQAITSTGASMSVTASEISIGPAPLKAFHFDATDCPDLFPPLVALAAVCEGTSAIQGAKRLTHKESNRALTLQEEFGKLGLEIRLQDDLMLITGTKQLKSASVSSHHDHRIAMACAVAALRADGEVVINGAEAIDKSYPAFYSHLQQLGVNVIYE